jgi:hypothetical protein
VLRGWGEGLLRRDNVDTEEEEKEAYPPAGTSLQEFTGLITPVSLYL